MSSRMFQSVIVQMKEATDRTIGVIDADGKLIGRLTIDEIVDVVYEETDNDLRRMGGLSDEEDVFAPVSKAVKTRWAGSFPSLP